MGRSSTKMSEVRVTGPLTWLAAGFKSVLLDAGYRPRSAVVQLRLMAHVSRWLEAGGLSAADLTEDRVEEFVQARRAAGYTDLYSRRALAPLLGFLAAHGAGPVEAPTPPTREEALLAAYRKYLSTERAFVTSTVSAYAAAAARFVAEYTVDGQVGTLTAADVIRAVQDECGRVAVGTAQYFVTALRSFLRFCRVRGLIDADLSAAALPVMGRRVSPLPKQISGAEAAALLQSCDRRRSLGRRNYAVVLMLLRLGVRAGEVAALRLEDIDWRAGQIVIRGKGRRDEALPLPVDVGEAIVGYLRRGRPATTRREVFVTSRAPTRGLTTDGVTAIVYAACDRAGLPRIGAHRLRHSAACAMVRADVPLPEIGQVLRHRDQGTTSVYARVDVDQLRRLARPWPVRGGERR